MPKDQDPKTNGKTDLISRINVDKVRKLRLFIKVAGKFGASEKVVVHFEPCGRQATNEERAHRVLAFDELSQLGQRATVDKNNLRLKSLRYFKSRVNAGRAFSVVFNFF